MSKEKEATGFGALDDVCTEVSLRDDGHSLKHVREEREGVAPECSRSFGVLGFF